MALWAVDIEKYYPSKAEYWTNRYIIQASDIGSAQASADAIVDIERAAHTANVTFTKYHLRDTDPTTDLFRVVFLTGVGDQAAVLAEQLPLFCVVRCDFTVANGRPSRKYIRMPLWEAVQADGLLTQAMIDYVQQNYVDPLVALSAYVDVDGEAIIGGSVFPAVAMRQLRRGSKRKQNPVLSST
jgi:hypothetical protein